MRLLIVTGMSGSGKTIVLHSLEDEGYYCIDNMPVFLLKNLADRMVHEPDTTYRLTAVGIDVRSDNEGFSDIPKLVKYLKDAGIECQIIGLEAQDEILIKRFSETRRKHPLTNKNRPLHDAISLERKLLEPLMLACSLRIDTSQTNLHQLRSIIRTRVAEKAENTLSLQIESFGFKHGVPSDADFVFDVRCLPNPHWQQHLRPLTGRDQPVADFLESQENVDDMYEDIRGFIERWIPCFQADGRSYLTVAVGCTGGQHRSVYMAERLGRYFETRDVGSIVSHRELGHTP
jgi:UPF0042 nucleotide-binding protein